MKQRRRQGRAFLAVAAGIALVVAACGSGGGGGGSDAGGGAPGPSGEPKRGGTLRYGLEAETDGLNPTTNRFAIAAYMMGNAVFDRLAYVDENDEIKPFLAESWTPSADSTSWEVKLRPGSSSTTGHPSPRRRCSSRSTRRSPTRWSASPPSPSSRRRTPWRSSTT